MSRLRTRWAAIGAAVAVTLGAGGIGIGHATTSSGERPVYVPIEPCRLASTRTAPDTVGPRATPLGPSETYDIDGWGAVGNCSLPNGTSALALNVTAVGATQQTNLRFFPKGAAVPTTANLNPTPGAPPTPNAVNVSLNDSNGQFSVFNRFGSVAIVIDVMGYYDHHTHDDRYAGRTQTTAYPGSALQFTGGDHAGVVNGCTVNGTDSSSGTLPLVLPVGATIVTADASIYDGAGVTGFTVVLARRRAGPSSVPFTTISVMSGGSQSGAIVDIDLTPAAPVVVEGDDVFEIAFFGGGVVLNNALCSARVTYELPAPT